MSAYESEYEEKLLEDLLEKYQTLGIVVWGEVEGAPGTYAKILVKSDGTVKVEGVTTISGDVDVSDRWSRQLGQIDIARYLGSAIGVANPLHSQIVYGGTVVDPRNIRALVSADIVTVYGSETQALLQRATTYDLIVQLRHAGSEIDPRDRNWTLNSSDVPDLSDRASRLLGVVYGSQGQQLLQRATTYESVVQLSHQGAEYDARQIRTLTSSDVVDVSDRASRLLGIVYGSEGQQLLQRATTYDLIVQLRHAGSEIDPRDRNWNLDSSDVPDLMDRAGRLLGIIYGDQGQLAQRATTRDLYVQLRHAGSEIDPREITDFEVVAEATQYLAPTSVAAGGTATVWTPATGYKIRLKRVVVSSDTATQIELRWATTGFESYFIPANGTVIINFIGAYEEGGVDEALVIYSSAAATITAKASGKEVT